MKAALIPPTVELDRYGHGEIHLILSHMLADPYYALHYEGEARRGAFIILDNSCHEHGSGNGAELLLDQALTVGAREIVASDELFSCEGTVTRSKLFIDYITTTGSNKFRQLDASVMLVPQANSFEEYRECLHRLYGYYLQVSVNRPDILPSVPTIGVSKDYEIWDGGIHRIISELLYDKVVQGLINVHCLGWGRKLWELPRIARDFPLIRSTDSAKPFVFAMNKIALSPGVDVEYPRRPANYFERRMTPRELYFADHNIEKFTLAAKGELTWDATTAR